MENQEKMDEGKSCCSASCCGKAFKALALVVLGGIVGFFAGRHCGMCPLKAAASAPAK